MSGVFSVLSDAQAGLFRLQQARKPWEKEIAAKDARGQLAEKAARATQPFQLTPEQQRDRATAKAALEEAKRVGGPKAAAEQKLAEVERKIEELKLAMRFAHGDRQKLAQLAHAASLLARAAGRAAKDYAVGVANAAEMGLPGGAGAVGTTGITTTTTVTSLTIRQTDLSVSLRVTLGRDRNGHNGGSVVSGFDAGADGLDPAGEDSLGALPGLDGLPPELPAYLGRMIDGALSGQPGSGGFAGSSANGDRAHAAMQRMMADHDLKMSRYKEADAFGRRVDEVLHVAKRVLVEAKVANAWDDSEKRRKERRDGFKVAEKTIDAAQKDVDALRQAAFGSSADASDPLGALDDAAGGAEAGLGTPDGIAAVEGPAVSTVLSSAGTEAAGTEAAGIEAVDLLA